VLLLSPHSEAIRDDDGDPAGTPDILNEGFEVVDRSTFGFETIDETTDDTILFPGETNKAEPGVGASCLGSFYKQRGNCGSIYVQSPCGLDTIVQLYCYNQDSQTSPGTKAGSNKPGVCQIPRTKPCYADEHCRRGTYCLPTDAAPVFYTCQEASMSNSYMTENKNRANAIVEMLLIVAVGYVESLDQTRVSGAQLHAVPTLIHDPRTGAVSPYGVNVNLAQTALGVMIRSFSSTFEATVQVQKASKSGAIFVYSGDGRFLIKSVRKEEFTNFAGTSAAKIASAGGLADVVCEDRDKEWCWAAAMLQHTALMVPMLAFSSPKTSEYWLVMPAAALFRGLAISQGETLEPWGEAAYFDVKPWPAKSNARERFLWKFARMNLLPFTDSSHGEENVNHWVSLDKSIQAALELLGGDDGDDSSSSVDYSLLFEVYKPNRTVTNPGRHCVASKDCFPSRDQSGCRVLCLSIIDFLTTFNFARKIESMWKDGKFNGYNAKVKELLNCMSAPRDTLPTRKQTWATQEDGQRTSVEKVSMPVDSAWETKRYRVCLPYLEMACSEFLTQTSGCDFEGTGISPRLKFTLTTNNHAPKFCFNWLGMMNWACAKRKKTRGELVPNFWTTDSLSDARLTYGYGATSSTASMRGPFGKLPVL